jgi:DNA mismatch repair protein MutS2
MISLLTRTAAALADDHISLGRRAADLLEWDRIAGQVAGFCLSRLAAEAIRARRPFATAESISLYHDLTDELRPGGDAGRWPPLLEVGEALVLLRRPAPIRLEGNDLVHIAAVAAELDRLRLHLLAVRETSPLWGEAAVQMSTFSGLTGFINRTLDPDGRIVDGASPLLARLRRSVAGQERAVRHEAGQAMAHARREGWTTGDEVTLRGDRFCLPLRSGDSRRIDGIVHDRSATGATLFVEPAGVVHMSNELVATRLEIAGEEARILFELNRAVERATPALDEAACLMLLLDTVRAPMLWSRRLRGSRPRLSETGEIRVCAGRHPLLLAALGEGNPELGESRIVPLDLELPPTARALVISGPNAGGKSVALKSVAVFCLLAQCGWDIPAREDTVLPRISRLLVNLGDDQSIAESLSSFSAHLRHLGDFMREADAGTLVVCDEIGSGTDPQEGTALAFAVLENLAASGARILASTHFGLLKAAVHDHPQMVNAAMDYDERDLQPLFTFRVGDPGTSHAFDIAARMGFPVDLLARARTMAGEEQVQVERLLADLDRRARELATAEVGVRQEATIAARRNAELEERLKGLKQESREMMRNARREAEELVRDGRRTIENVVREIRTADADKTVVKSARDRIDRLGEQLRQSGDEGADAGPPTSREVVVGQRVRIPHLGLIGNVVEVRGNRLVALAEGLRLNLTLAAVRHLDHETAGSPPASGPGAGSHVPVDAGSWTFQSGDQTGAEHEIDLRGENGEEGWQRLDKLIDRSIPAGLEVIHVIHGFGTGRLRDHLYERLRRDPRVKSIAEAAPGEGGGGATRVTLASK